MAVAPSVQASTEPTDAELASRDQLSPTTLVLQALRKAGKPITNDNIRRFVEANARESGQSGPDPIVGLRSGPVEDSGPSVGQRSSAAKAVEGGAKKEGYIDDGTFTDGGDQSGSRVSSTSTQPSKPPDVVPPSGSQPPMYVDPATGLAVPIDASNTDHIGPDDWLSFLGPAGIAAAIQAAAAIPKMGGGRGEFVGNSPIPPTGRVMDVPPTGVGSDMPTLQVTGQRPQIAGPQAASPPPSPMEMSMQNAKRPALGASVGPPLPPQPTGPGTTIIPPNPTAGVPRVPLRPGAGAAGPMPGAGFGVGQRILRGLRIP